MRTTNWRAMQVPPTTKARGAAQEWPKPGDVKPRYLTMGSWTPRRLRRANG